MGYEPKSAEVIAKSAELIANSVELITKVVELTAEVAATESKPILSHGESYSESRSNDW